MMPPPPAVHEPTMHCRLLGGPFFSPITAVYEHQNIAPNIPRPSRLVDPIFLRSSDSRERDIAAFKLPRKRDLYCGMGSYRPGFSNNIDPKFGWCWRKEEKKWLCLKDVILNDKYSERHMNIGYYNGSRKSVERGTGETSRSSLGVKAAKNSEQARQMHLLNPYLAKAFSVVVSLLKPCKFSPRGSSSNGSHRGSFEEVPQPMGVTGFI